MQMFRNQSRRNFEDISKASGVFEMPPIAPWRCFGDVYNDGSKDISGAQHRQAPSLLITRPATATIALPFNLIGTKSNRAASARGSPFTPPESCNS